MKLLIGAIILCVATRASGAVIDAGTVFAGPLGVAVTTVASTVDQLQFPTNSKTRAVNFTIRNTAGTATAEVQQNCTGNAADWAQVANSPRTLTVSAGIVTIQNPFCQYRVAATACTTCNVLVFYNLQPDL